MPPRQSSNIILTSAYAVSLGFGLLALLYAIAGWWMRPMGDDYLFIRHLDHYGYLGAEIVWWQTWHGRWASQLLISALYGTGYWFVPILPLTLTALWGTFGIILLRRLGLAFLEAAAFMACVLGMTFSMSPDIVDSLYWAAASLFHVLPLALTSLLGLLLLSKSESPFRLPAVALCSLLLAGMSELYDVWLVPTLFVFALVRRDRYAWTAFIMATLGSVMLILAPGNFMRASEYEGKMSVNRTLIQTFYWSGYLWLHYLLDPTLILGMLTALLLGYTGSAYERIPPLQPRWTAAPALVGVAATYLCLLPVIHGTKGTAPQLRVYFPPTYLAILGLLGAAFLMGVRWRQRRGKILPPRPLPVVCWLLLTAVAGLPAAFIKGGQMLQGMRVFEAAWTARDTSLKQQAAASKKRLYCRRVELPGTMQHDIWQTPTHYVNDILAYHYTRDPDVRVMMIQDKKTR